MSAMLDDVARRLAEPMPRRRALRVLAAGLVAAALPLGRGRAAHAQSGVCGDLVSCGDPSQPNHSCCEPTQRCCPIADGGLCVDPGYTCCSRRYRYDDAQGQAVDAFCAPDERCVRERCVKRCPGGRPRCGGRCCRKTEECVRGRCRRRCPGGAPRCGRRCCPRGHRCADARRGICRRCRRGREACGKACCGRRSYCCDPRKGLCCPRKGGSCCPTPSGKGRMCCRGGTRCARPVNVGPSGTSNGVNASAPHQCCPSERYVERYSSCCPPGHVSLGDRFVLPPGGGGGVCCRKDKLCGDSCCGTGGPGFPELDQTCCGGRCTSLANDSQNCGSCGAVCPAGHRCQGGACVPA